MFDNEKQKKNKKGGMGMCSPVMSHHVGLFMAFFFSQLRVETNWLNNFISRSENFPFTTTCFHNFITFGTIFKLRFDHCSYNLLTLGWISTNEVYMYVLAHSMWNKSFSYRLILHRLQYFMHHFDVKRKLRCEKHVRVRSDDRNWHRVFAKQTKRSACTTK